MEDRRIYKARFRHNPCQELVPSLDQPLFEYEAGTNENRLAAVGGNLRLQAVKAHLDRCSQHAGSDMDDFTVVSVLLNGVAENPQEAEREYREAREEQDNY